MGDARLKKKYFPTAVGKFENQVREPDSTYVCPLCLGSRVRLVGQLYTADLAKLYRKLFRREISEEFHGATTIRVLLCAECDLRFTDPSVTGSKQFYEDLQDFPWYYSDQRTEYDFASVLITETDRVLDIGCGRGAFSKHLKTQQYIGLEFNQKAVKEANLAGIVVFNQSIEEFCIDNQEAFSVICAFQVMEHISDVGSFLQASIRCLRPGGLFIVSMPSADSFMSVLRNDALNLPPHHVTWWSDDCLRNMVHYFKLDLIQLKHEKLTDAFKQRYMSAVVLEGLSKCFGLASNLVDLSWKGRMAATVSAYMGKLLSGGLNDPRLMPDGHSIFAVYRKKSTA